MPFSTFHRSAPQGIEEFKPSLMSKQIRKRGPFASSAGPHVSRRSLNGPGAEAVVSLQIAFLPIVCYRREYLQEKNAKMKENGRAGSNNVYEQVYANYLPSANPLCSIGVFNVVLYMIVPSVIMEVYFMEHFASNKQSLDYKRESKPCNIVSSQISPAIFKNPLSLPVPSYASLKCEIKFTALHAPELLAKHGI